MSEIISRRQFLTNGLIFSGTLLAEACAPKPLKPSNIISSLTAVPSITPEPTNTSLPNSELFSPIEAKTWAEKIDGTGLSAEKVPGSIDPHYLYRYVGGWKLTTPDGRDLAITKNRAVDLMWEGMRLVYVDDQDIQQEGFDRKGYREYIAGELSKQVELKSQLSQIKENLAVVDQTPGVMTVVINGPEFSNNSASYIPGFNETNAHTTGIAANIGSYPKWYKYDGQNLSRMRIDESPMLLPPLRSEGGRVMREDNGEEEMMRGINFAGFRLNIARDAYSELLQVRFQELKDSGGNFLTIQLDRNTFYSAGFYPKLAQALGMARNIYGLRVMLTLGWDKNISGEMIRVPDQQMVDDWKTFVNFTDENNSYVDPDQNFGSLLRRTVDIFQMQTEPSGDFTYFNPYMDAACVEIKAGVSPDAICGFSDGDFWATDAVELLGAEGDAFRNSHPDAAVVIHPFKLDNHLYEPQDGEFTNDERPDPMLYVKQLKEKGILVVIGEAGWEDWNMNKDWLMNLFQYCEDNNIPYAIDGDVSQISGFWQQILKERAK